MSSTTDTENGNVEVCDVDLNVSASETSKGGVKYEVILSQASVSTPTRAISPTAKPLVSVEIIRQKLEQAAERRQSLETEKLAVLAEKLKKIEEVTKKKAEEEANFINTTKETLDQKMGACIENRENYITEIKVKMSNHNTSHLQEVRQNMETSLSEFEEKAKEELAKKLEAAEINREKVIQSKLESLKKHDEKAEQIRNLKRSSTAMEDCPSMEEGAGDK